MIPARTLIFGYFSNSFFCSGVRFASGVSNAFFTGSCSSAGIFWSSFSKITLMVLLVSACSLVASSWATFSICALFSLSGFVINAAVRSAGLRHCDGLNAGSNIALKRK